MREQDLTDNRMRQVNVTENLEVRDRENRWKETERENTQEKERLGAIQKLNVFNL